jgi:PAS domain S-box-containing protein
MCMRPVLCLPILQTPNPSEYKGAVGSVSPRRFGAWPSTKAVLVLLASLLFHAISSAQIKEVRRVLVLNDLGIVSSPGFAEIDQALYAGLQESPYQIEFYEESLQLSLFPDAASDRRIREEFIRKYSGRKLDVIIAAGSDSLKFIAESNEKFLRDTPIIFCAILGEIPDRLGPDMHFTGVLGRLQPEETLNVALRLLPSTKHVVVTGGMGKFDDRWEAIAKQSFHKYESKLDFMYLTDLTMPTLLERLRNLPNNTIVYHTAISQDAAGERFIDSAQAVPLVASASNAPVFVMDDVDLRGGAVGGDLVNWADDARVAAGMAVRVLNGERPQDIPIVTSNNHYMFDWRAIKRWGIKESNLPPGSTVLRRQLGFWELYARYVLLGIFALLAQAAAIVGLLWQRARRRKTEEKFSKAFRQSPLAFAITTTKDHRYVEVNDTFERHSGWRRDEVIGRTPLDIGIWVDPNQRFAFIEQLVAKGRVQELEIKFRTKDGQIRTGLGSAELIEIDGEPCALSVIADVTERKMAEEALASMSRRLIEAQEQERTRIARELHDDINQRIAMLSIDVERLEESGSPSGPERQSRVKGLQKRLMELGSEVQAISHRLHSSKLEYLGLAVASKSFCREVAERHKVTIDFAATDVPPEIPREVSLCLFRVLQESLNNAIKYSGVQHFEAHLRGISDEIELAVRDNGVGFDVEAAMSSQGLGLISMRERACLVGGTMLVTSKPMGGTEVSVRVPLVSPKATRDMASRPA